MKKTEKKIKPLTSHHGFSYFSMSPSLIKQKATKLSEMFHIHNNNNLFLLCREKPLNTNLFINRKLDALLVLFNILVHYTLLYAFIGKTSRTTFNLFFTVLNHLCYRFVSLRPQNLSFLTHTHTSIKHLIEKLVCVASV